MKESSLKKNTLLLTIGTTVNKGLQFLVIPFFTRWLTQDDYGQFDLMYSYIMLLLPILSLATQEAIFRFNIDNQNEKRKKANITNSFIINVTLSIVYISTFAYITNWTSEIYIWYCVYLIAELMAQHLRGYLRSIKRLDIYSYAMVISTICMAISVTIELRILNKGLVGILMGYALGIGLGDVIIILWSHWIQMVSFKLISLSIVKKLLRYSLPLVPNDVSWWVMNASDRQIINLYYYNSGNAIYAIAHKISSMCSIIFNMFSISWQQDVIEKIDDPDRNAYFDEVFNTFFVMLLTICSGLLSCNALFYYFIFDDRYFAAIYYSPILIVAVSIMAISQFFGAIQIALKQSGKNGLTTLTGAILNVVLHLCLIREIGLFAAAISTLLANLVVVIFRAVLVKNTYRMRLSGKSYIVLLFYVYFFGMSYLHKYMWLNGVNITIAGFLFLFMNRSFIISFLKKKNPTS